MKLKRKEKFMQNLSFTSQSDTHWTNLLYHGLAYNLLLRMLLQVLQLVLEAQVQNPCTSREHPLPHFRPRLIID